MTAFRHTNADSLRGFAARRRAFAEDLREEIIEARNLAAKHRANGKAFVARNFERLANLKERSRTASLKAADTADRRADEMEGTSNQKEMAS